jgi:predicted metal-dependent hydrolase
MRKLKIGEEEVNLDPANLRFSEESLNDFLCKFAGIYAYYNQKWAEAQYINYCHEDRCEYLYSKKFEMYKQDNPVALAEAKAKADDEVKDAKMLARKTKLHMQELQGYLKALDKAHDNALNLGYNIRKEMGNLQSDIRFKGNDLDRRLDEIMKED